MTDRGKDWKALLVAGEASGDARGAELMRALLTRDPTLEFFGAGGREMRGSVANTFSTGRTKLSSAFGMC